MVRPTYFDWNATTPIHPQVLKVMDFYFRDEFGNAGSRTHIFGLEAKKVVAQSREKISTLLNAEPNEVIFTSGATESNNISILGLIDWAKSNNKTKIITTRIEHKAVLEPVAYLEKIGFDVEYLSTDTTGRINPEELKTLLDERTGLVSIMHVNNETGIIQPIPECCEILRTHDAYFHVDAAQGFAKLIQPLQNKRIDMISFCGHKIQGPKGVGGLCLRKRRYKRPPLTPLMYGGGQELGLRPGTLPVALIAGLSKAAELIATNNSSWWQEKIEIKKTILSELNDSFILAGDQDHVMPNCICAIFPEWDSEAFIMANKERWAISNGSACTSEKIEPSHVLLAMGLDSTHGWIRFSF